MIYLLVYGQDPTDRLAAYAFPDRPTAVRAATTSIVPPVPADARGGGVAMVVESAVDVTLSKAALATVCQDLTGNGPRSFETRAHGVARLLALLPLHAKKFDGDCQSTPGGAMVGISTEESALSEQHEEQSTESKPKRQPKIGEFKQVREGTKLGQIIKSIQEQPRDLATIALDTGMEEEEVERRLKDARRSHGIDHTFDGAECVTLVAPTFEILKVAEPKPEKAPKGFKPPKLGQFAPVREGTTLARLIEAITTGDAETMNSIAEALGTDAKRVNGLLRSGLGVGHGIGHVVNGDGSVSLILPEGKAVGDLVRAKPQPKPKGNGEAKPHGKYEGHHVITLLVTENPKKMGAASHTRFALYRDGMTVEQALAAGVERGDLSWDTNHGFIAIG